MDINTVITIPMTIRGQERSVPVTDVPIITAATKEVFEELGYFGPDLLTHPMRRKAETLAAVIGQAQSQRPITLKDRLKALVRAALNVAIIAGGVLGMALATSPALGLPGLLVSCVAGIALGIYNMSRIMDSRKPARGSEFILLVALLSGPFCALYEAFRSTPNFDDTIAKKKEKMTHCASVLTHYFDGTKTDKLRSAIEKKVQETEVLTTQLQGLPINLTAGRQQLDAMRVRYQTALSQLNQAVAFYKQPEAGNATA